MFTDQEIRSRFDSMFKAFLRAGWITRFSFTDGKGWQVDWTGPGAQRAALLKQIITSHNMTKADRGPMCFDKSFHGESLPPCGISEPDPELAKFWREQIQQLGIKRDEDTLLVFAHIIIGWAPHVVDLEDGDLPSSS